jgi:hypothetical protein
MDLQSRAYWVEYSRGKDEMFAHTDIKPGALVRGPCRRQKACTTERNIASAVSHSPRRFGAETDEVAILERIEVCPPVDPGTERRPGSVLLASRVCLSGVQHPVQIEVVEFAPLADMRPLAAFVSHADLLQDARRCCILPDAGRIDTSQLQRFEAVVQCRARCFGRITTSPKGNSNPVAEFGVLMILVDA